MRSLVRPILSTRRSLLRSLSSLALGHILQGAHWNYHIIDAVKGDITHASIVFKAEVIPHEHTLNVPQRFVVSYRFFEIVLLTRYPGQLSKEHRLLM
jgi:hypothetical protein